MSRKHKPALAANVKGKNQQTPTSRAAAAKSSPGTKEAASAGRQTDEGRRTRPPAAGAAKSDPRRRPATLIERVRQDKARSEAPPTLAESEAVGLVLSTPGMLDDLREQAFVALTVSLERKLAELGHRLTRFEAANVAWRILER
jgi:hypothetical protein